MGSVLSQKKWYHRRERNWGDHLFKGISAGAGLLVVGLFGWLVFQVYDLGSMALQAFGWSFFKGTNWDPANVQFEVLPFIYGTVLTSVLALILSVPVSLGVALFLTEMAPPKLARWLGGLVELLAAIPSVVYGLWGIFVLSPVMLSVVQPFLIEHLGFLPFFRGPAFGVGLLTAALILAVMITPTVTSICREIFLTVPRAQREAALGLGATRWEMVQLSVLPASFPGIMGAVILGLGRAMGETMAVTMVIGNRPEISLSLFSPAQTMASLIANEYGEALDALHVSALAAVGFTLFLVSLVINALARWVVYFFSKRRGLKMGVR